jgi:hypothetical protein
VGNRGLRKLRKLRGTQKNVNRRGYVVSNRERELRSRDRGKAEAAER